MMVIFCGVDVMRSELHIDLMPTRPRKTSEAIFEIRHKVVFTLSLSYLVVNTGTKFSFQ